MRSLTLRTVTPGTWAIASVIRSAWSTSEASQVTSTTIRSAWLSATSSAVSAPPAELTAVVRAAVAWATAGASTRTVME